MTIQDILDWCTERKYPLSARLVFEDTIGVVHELDIDGCHGHGHDEPETLILCEQGHTS